MPDAPYTGTSSAAAVATPSPRIRWGLMAIVHFAAAFLAGFAFPVVGTAFDPQWILIGLSIWILVAWAPHLQSRPVR